MITHEEYREIVIFEMWCSRALCELRSLEGFPVSSRELFLTGEPYLGKWAGALWWGAFIWMGAMVGGGWSFRFPAVEVS